MRLHILLGSLLVSIGYGQGPVLLSFEDLAKEFYKEAHAVSNHAAGYITAADLETVIRKDYDFDGNGEISKSEFLQSVVGVNPNFQKIYKCLYLEFDINLDGKLTISDFDKMIYLMDTSNDKDVNQQEFVSYFTALIRRADLDEKAGRCT